MPWRIRVGDLVHVTAGANRGQQGKVMAIDTEKRRVRVEKVRMQKHHVKPGRKIARTGGIIEQEGYIDASNVMLVDPSSQQPSRVRIRTEGDQRVRSFVRSGEDVPRPTS